MIKKNKKSFTSLFILFFIGIIFLFKSTDVQATEFLSINSNLIAKKNLSFNIHHFNPPLLVHNEYCECNMIFESTALLNVKNMIGLSLSTPILFSGYAFLKNWWLLIIIALVAIIFIIYLLRKYLALKEKIKGVIFQQQQFIRAERQRISGEIHDDIGSGLFAIQLLADMASKKRTDVEELKQVSDMINEMSEKINEVIWSTNSDSDNLENLLYYIEHQTIKLFQYTSINYVPNFPLDIPTVEVNSQSRRNTYLLIKEVIYNSIKHAKASTVYLDVTISNGILVFIIKDNGVGFDPKEVRPGAMGLKNIKNRIEKLEGSLIIENYKGTIVKIKIPIKGY